MIINKALLNAQHPSLKWGFFQKILYVEPTLCNLQLHEEVWGAGQGTAASLLHRAVVAETCVFFPDSV